MLNRRTYVDDLEELYLEPPKARGASTAVAVINAKGQAVELDRFEVERLVDAGLEALDLAPLVDVARIRERIRALA